MERKRIATEVIEELRRNTRSEYGNSTSIYAKIQKRYFWKGLSYCKNLEEVKISFLFQSLGLDTSERKYIIKKLILGNLKLFDILLLKKQIKDLEKYIDVLKLPEVYDYPSFILSNSLKQCFKMNENKSVLKNILKKIPDFNIDLLKETKPY